MQLIIGGFTQGKLDYAKSLAATECGSYRILDERSKEKELFDFFEKTSAAQPGALIVNHLHLLLKSFPDRDACLNWCDQLRLFCETAHIELFFLADEMGNGLIPASYEERCYREDVGRLLCLLAARAEHVIRIVCGLPGRLK